METSSVASSTSGHSSTASSPSRSLSALVAELDETLTAADSRRLGDGELVESIRTLEVLARKVSSLQYAMAAEVDGRSSEYPDLGSLSHEYGCRNAVELLQQLTQCSRFSAARQIRLGAKLAPRQGYSGEELPPTYPAIADALAEGSLCDESARVMIDTLERTQHKISPLDQPVAEQHLVAGATGGLTDDGVLPGDGEDPVTGLPENADAVKVRAKSLALYFDQDGKEPSPDRAALRRGFRFGRERDGLVPVSGALLPETAALLGRLFDSVNSPRVANAPEPPRREVKRDESFTHFNEAEYTPFDPQKPGRTVRFEPSPEQGANAPGATEVDFQVLHDTDNRSADQKRHDAFATLLATAAKHPDTPLLGGAPVTVLIQATEEALDPTTRSGTAWLHDHDGSATPHRLTAVRHAACSGGLQRVTQAPNGRILELETPQRIFNAHQRRAIMLRDGGCIIPGCTVPATWCEIHHVTEWSKGGKTHTDNGVLMCFYHHRYLESSGWAVRMRDGVPQVRPPERLHGNTLWWSVRPATRPPVLHNVA